MTEPRSRLVVVRHGETGWSREGRHTGRTDVALDPAGRLQAVGLGEGLAGERFESVWSSPSSRAVETCRLAGFDDRAVLDDDLREWDYGDDEGRTTEEIRELRPGWTLWTGGVPNGETATDVGRRADRVIERARAAKGDTLCFAHGHILRVLAARWLGLPPTEGRLFALGAGSTGVLGWEREAPVIQRWNEPARLPR